MLVDRYGRKIIIVPATILSGVSLVLFLLAPTYAWFLAACAAWSVAMGISGAAPAAYAADTAPPRHERGGAQHLPHARGPGLRGGPDRARPGRRPGRVPTRRSAATAALLVAVALLFARFAPETYRAARF